MKRTHNPCIFDNGINNNFCLKVPKLEIDKENIYTLNKNFSKTIVSFHPLYDLQILDNFAEKYGTTNAPLPQESITENENDKVYEKIINNFCQLLQTQFTDCSFLPIDKSIGNLQKFKNIPIQIVWLRPYQIISWHENYNNYFLWDVLRDPSPLDIKQGAVGDCWLIACIALIAERPDILDKIILTKTYNPNGIYKIQLCIDGIYKSVYIDDYFPCNHETNEMLFAKGKNKQLWPSLIEKALAKILGSYEALDSGFMKEGFGFLTGAPCESIETKIDCNQSQSVIENEKHKIWSKLRSAKDANFLIGASCGSDPNNYMNKRDFEIVGLVKNHSYSILDVRNYKEKKLIKLREPNDTFAWKGEWGKDWHGWTETVRGDLKMHRNIEKNGGGTFWMPYDSFLRYFDSIVFAYIRKGWKEGRFSFEISPQNCETFYLSITERTEICLNVFQRNVWKIPDKSDVMILVHKNNYGQPGELIAKSERKHTSSVLLKDAFYESGDYIVIVYSITAICNNAPLSCALAIHSSKQISIIQKQHDFDFYRKSLIQLALNTKSQEEMSTNMLLYKIEDNKSFNGVLLMAENNNKHMHFQFRLEQTLQIQKMAKVQEMNLSLTIVYRQCIDKFSLYLLTRAKLTEASDLIVRFTFCSSNSPYLPSHFTPKPLCLHLPPQMHLFDLHITTPIF